MVDLKNIDGVIHVRVPLEDYEKLASENAALRAQVALAQRTWESHNKQLGTLARENEDMREHITMGEETILRLQGKLAEVRGSVAVFKEHNEEINSRLDKMGIGGSRWQIASRLDDIGNKLDELKEARKYARIYYRRVEKLEKLIDIASWLFSSNSVVRDNGLIKIVDADEPDFIALIEIAQTREINQVLRLNMEQGLRQLRKTAQSGGA